MFCPSNWITDIPPWSRTCSGPSGFSSRISVRRRLSHRRLGMVLLLCCVSTVFTSRLCRLYRRSVKEFVNRGSSKTKVESVLTLLVESGALYCIYWVREQDFCLRRYYLNPCILYLDIDATQRLRSNRRLWLWVASTQYFRT